MRKEVNDMNETTTTISRPSRDRRGPWKWAAAVAIAAVALYFVVIAVFTGGPIAITANEYSFEGVPRELIAGEHRFQLTNIGDEPHEMVLVRLKDGVSSVDQVLALPQEEAMSKVEMVGQAQAEPGKRSEKLTVNLQPGRYALLCFVPTGENGPPHVEHGMKASFTVK
jgi:uncharacterized cupredoxin-like copper-binding protein